MGYLEDILGESEKVVFGTRKHWLVIARTLFFMGLLSAVILAVSAVLAVFTAGMSLLGLILLVFPITRLAFVLIEWSNERYIVTNRRIIQMQGVFNKHVVDSSLEKVNDVVLDQSFWGRMWGYGDIEILTASDIGVNKLRMLAQPLLFKTTMLDQKEGMSSAEAYQRPLPSTSAESPEPADVPDLIAELASLRDRGILTPEEFERKKAEMLSRM